jgi:hypothetical protein
MIYKKLLILSAVAVVSYATTNFNFVNSQATLSKPSVWDYSYSAGATGNMSYRSRQGGTGDDLYRARAGFRRTTESGWYNYTHILTEDTFDKNGFNSVFPNGLEVIMQFKAANNTWVYDNIYQTYEPALNTTYIGTTSIGDNTNNKVYLQYDNQTNRDYKVWIDMSSMPNDVGINAKHNTLTFGNADYLLVYQDGNFITLIVNAYSTLTLWTDTTVNARSFDAWYLQDLGINGAYLEGIETTISETETYITGYDNGYENGVIAGYDDGYLNGLEFAGNDNYLEGYNAGMSAMAVSGGMFSLIENVFGGVANIFNIALFGGITLGSIVLAPIAISLMWFLLGIIGGRGKS